MTKHKLKEQLFFEIEQLPPYRLQEVLDFVHFLRTRPFSIRPELDPDLEMVKDPIEQFIGGVSHGTLAQAIDEELYGA